MDTNLVDRFEAAKILGILPRSVQRLAQQGRIPYAVVPGEGKTGPGETRLYPRDELQRMVDELYAPAQVDSDFGNWLAGLIDGEGSFLVEVRKQPSGYFSYDHGLKITLRNDDTPLLILILETTGIGRLNLGRERKQKGGHVSKATCHWNVHSNVSCIKLIGLLDKYPLRSKKRRDYLTWREFVLERQKEEPDHEKMVGLAQKLQNDRQYSPPSEEDVAKAREMEGRTEFHLRKFVR